MSITASARLGTPTAPRVFSTPSLGGFCSIRVPVPLSTWNSSVLLGRRIARVRLVIGRVGMQVGAEPPGGDAEQPSVFARPRHRLYMSVFACRAHEQDDLA